MKRYKSFCIGVAVVSMLATLVFAYADNYGPKLPLELPFNLSPIGTSSVISWIAMALSLVTSFASLFALVKNKSLKWSNGKPFPLQFLKAFSWFCCKANREIVQFAIADLKRDKREMKREGRGFWFITAVVFWRTLATIVPITWDGVVRVVKAIMPFAKYFKG